MGFKRNYSVEITEIRHIDINIEADTEKVLCRWKI